MITGQVSGTSGVSKVYNKQGVSKIEKSKAVQGKKDDLTISSAGQDFNVVMKALREVPDIRQDRVDEIRAKIQDGTYNVAEDDITEKLAKDIADKLS